jgi:hypothetical protein
MKEARVELFSLMGRVDWLCITTNGTRKNDGSAVMGRGCALQAKERWPELPAKLGRTIKQFGNLPHTLGAITKAGELWELTQHHWNIPSPSIDGISILWSFPVKHYWGEPASLGLIETSARMMMFEAKDLDVEIALPLPGCGNGGRSWSEVGPILHSILDNRFTAISL